MIKSNKDREECDEALPPWEILCGHPCSAFMQSLFYMR